MGKARSPRAPRAPRSAAPAADSKSRFPTLEDFVLQGNGQISVGEIGPIPCAAVASDDHNMLAALQRRKGETLMQLLQRLDAALLRALEYDEFTDEING
jgi:hypothetical protein